MDWQIPLFKIYQEKSDVDAVIKTISRGMSWAVGPEVTQFEEELAAYLNVKHCLVFNSGTSGLHAALLAYGIGEGDEVIVPSFTFISTVNSPLFVGARPVFADIEETTLGLDPSEVEKKITPKTKAIIGVDFTGCPCQLDLLREIARRHKLILIEDAAEALGAAIKDCKAGALADTGILSFCQNKTIATGEGGAAATNNTEVYEKMKLIRSHGLLETKGSSCFSSNQYMDYVALGYNFRMSSITAALGLAQLAKLDKMVGWRRDRAARYDDKLSGLDNLLVSAPPPGFYHAYQMYAVRVKSGKRDGLMQFLAEKGIMSKVFFYPVHFSHFYRKELKYNVKLPVTEMISDQIVSLPMHPKLSDREIDEVSSRIAEYLAGAK
jgi:perosamine synthetase